MSSLNDLDTGPLTWVKGEIDLALGRASSAVEAAEAGQNRSNQLQFAQTHLHQVRGALSIVGLDGLTTFADSLDRLLAELARGERDYRSDLADLARRALAAIGNYLDELSHGVPDQALRLLPLMRELAKARGLPEPSPADLFFPDLGQRVPRKLPAPPANAARQLAERIRPLRGRFQNGLLTWLRKPDLPDGPRTMAAVCREVESLQSAPTARNFWWAASALLETLATGVLARDPLARLACSRIEQQLKRVAAGQTAPSEKLHREVMYLIAIAPQREGPAAEVREAYHLDRLIPGAGSTLCDQPLAPLLTRLRSLFAAARTTWDHFAGGAAAALPQFEEDLRSAIEASAPLGRPAFRHLLDSLSDLVAWLRKDPLRGNEQVALEVASAVMLAETALETGRVPDASFTAQVTRSVARLNALIAGQDPDALDAGDDDLPDAAREAQERLALGQLAREMQVNLAQVEQTLDEYFRRPERRAQLTTLDAPLRQIEGVLTVLGEDRALEVLRDCEARIRHLAGSTEEPPEGEFEHLAHHLSAFGFFVQDLQRGNADLDRLLAGGEEVEPVEEHESEPAEMRAEVEEPPAPVATAAPVPAAADEPLELEDALDVAESGVPPTAAPVPPPPAPELLQSSDEEIDSELLEIFLEEGREVVATIGEQLAKSRANPRDVELVTTIRRGFHTLKGSGRMVGLTDLGEAAWGMEQTMNRWLQLEWPPTPALHDLIEAAHELFNRWIDQLAAGGGVFRDAREILAEAERLRTSDTPIDDSALGATPSVATEMEVEAGAEGDAEPALPTLTDIVPDLPLESDLTLDEVIELVEPADEAEVAEAEFELEALAEQPEPAGEGPVPELEETDGGERLRETALEFGDLTREPLDDGVLPIGTIKPFTGVETSLDALEQSETSPVEEIDVSFDEIDFGDLGGDEAAFELGELPADTDIPGDESPAAEHGEGGGLVLEFGGGRGGDAQEPPQAEAPAAVDDTGAEESEFGEDAAATVGAEDESAEWLASELEAGRESLDLGDLEELTEGNVVEPLELDETPLPGDAVDLGEPPESGEVLEPGEAEILGDFAPPGEAYGPADALDLDEVLPRAEAPHEEPAGPPTLEGPDTAEVVEDLAALEVDEALALPLDDGGEDLGEALEALEALEVEGGEFAATDETPETVSAEIEPDQVRLGENVISRPLFELYLAEARQHLATLKREVGHLAGNPTLMPADPAIRAAHTLAGISGTAHVEAIHALAKSLEHAQARFRDSAQPPAGEQTELLARTVETLEAMLVEVSRESLPLEVPELVEQLDGMPRSGAAEAVPAPMPPESEAPREAEAAAPAEHAPVLRDELDEQLLPIFLEEAAELLDQLHAGLREWRGDPDRAAPVPAIARQLHTLKGSARMAGAMSLGEQVHALETQLQQGAGDPVVLIDALETGLDTVSLALDAIVGGPLPEDEAPPSDVEEPAIADTGAPATQEVAAPLAERDAASAGSVRVRADLVDKFVNEAGEIGIARTRIDGELRTLRRSLLDLTENVIRLRNQLREIEIQAETQLQSRIALSGSADGEFDPLELDRFTRLQELTRMMAESVNDVTTVQHNLLRNLDGAEAALSSQARLNRDLQQALMRVRMVPFDSIADRLHRVVRQSAKDMGKRVTLDIRAGNIEIDRGVLERMTAPLEHLLRNSIAHGIESLEQRRAAGKADIGQITLALAQEGNEIAIELADDGAGLNFERIRQRALENRLIAPEDAQDEQRLTNLIFMPGFSTATSLSQVSGRGVGMDVVKSETAAVGGRIDISSTAGQGTRFRIYLPVNLAVTQALLVRAGPRTYAIPSTMVAQVRELKADALEELRRERIIEWQDQTYAYRYLPRLVGDADTQPEIQRFNWVLLLRAGAQTLALHVDGLRGNQEIVVKNAGPHIARIVGISGATVMGDGEIVLILNPVALATRSDVIPEDDREVRTARAEIHVPTVMVVDDSLTVRKITGRLLEREGYRVVTAKDGVDALERLIDTVPDVVLSDIEMPRMDGFDLARNIRADQRLKALPIIMITSRLADKHKEYAREIGVDHYLGKPYDEQELLRLIGDYAPLHATAH